MDLMHIPLGQPHNIQQIQTGDHALENFLFTLGCFVGEPITVIARRRGSCTVSIKDGRYCIDRHLAQAILV